MMIERTTARLQLRQWRPEDLAPFAELNGDPRVMAYFPSVLSRAESDAMAHRCTRLIAERGWGFWAVELRATGQFIGFVGLHVPSSDLPFSPCVEIGWRLAAGFWGRGYATEAARESLSVGFVELGLSEIVSFTTVTNYRSRALMERLGMQLAASTFAHPHVPSASGLREHCLYRLPSALWRRQSSRRR